MFATIGIGMIVPFESERVTTGMAHLKPGVVLSTIHTGTGSVRGTILVESVSLRGLASELSYGLRQKTDKYYLSM